jgi:thiamine-phosphate pyrophosphorylase
VKHEALPPSPFLYPILDAGFSANLLIDARDVVRAGAEILQIRVKNQSKKWVHETIQRILEFDVCCIVNDMVDIALTTDVAGVHLGQTDFPVTDARTLLPSKIIGFSSHNVEQFEIAQQLPVNYVAIGPVFGTTSKENPDPPLGTLAVEKIIRNKTKPVVAIGGIVAEHIPALIRTGIDGIAVISALYQEGTIYENASRLMERIHAEV